MKIRRAREGVKSKMKGMRVECDTIAIPTVEALEKRMSELEKRVAALEERTQERP